MAKTKGMRSFFTKMMAVGLMGLAFTPVINGVNYALNPSEQVVYAQLGQSRSVSNSNTEDDAQGRLRAAIDEAVAGNNYRGKDDKNYKGSDLVKNGVTTDLVSNLQRSEAERLLSDMNKAAEDLIKKDANTTRENGGTASASAADATTKSNWLADLRVSPGLGTAQLTAALNGFQPDLVSGHSILQPFEGPLGIIAGIFIIIATLGLVFTITIDLAYLYFPLFQQTVDGLRARANQNGKGGEGRTQVIVSREAIAALEESENGSNGKKRSPYLLYFMKKGVSMFFFGILLLYLASGSIWKFVGLLLSLLEGMGLA